jgi:hypothetical protein
MVVTQYKIKPRDCGSDCDWQTVANDVGAHCVKPHIAAIETIIAEVFEANFKIRCFNRKSLIDAGYGGIYAL